MNLQSERSPGSEPAGGIVDPQGLPIHAVSLPSKTAESVVRSAPEGDILHTVSAIYPSRAEAEGVRHHLIDRGFAASEVRIAESRSDSLTWPGTDETGRDEVLTTVLVDSAIGTAVGTGVGVAGTVALAAAGVTLFVASPVVAPLAMLGWFAGLGGVVGAAVGANSKKGRSGHEGKFSELVMDAVEGGNTALVVRTHNEVERELAKRIITDSLHGTDQIPTQA